LRTKHRLGLKESILGAKNTGNNSLDDLLAQYAAGGLGHGMAVLMASYVTLSGKARADLDTLEHLNGVMLDEAEPVAVSASMLSSLESQLDTPEPEPIAVPDLGVHNEDLPSPLRAVLNAPIEQSKWRFAYPGVRQMELAIGDRGEKVKLLKIKPGKAAPRHTHKGVEATLVLRGAFSDGNRLYERGDVAIADHDVQHRPRAQGEEDCICLAVTDGALRFADTIAHVARDFLAR
jgi:putative transcriptional regulator